MGTINENTTLGQLDGMLARRDVRVNLRLAGGRFYVAVRPSFNGLLENLDVGSATTLAGALAEALSKFDARRRP